ncbi:MAG: hypothetical protein H7Y15_16160 [Pseudonocardia sp.]|nr:hypothetical protein [Pseudonocardia sp.]
MARTRRWLGDTTDNNKWLPDMGTDRAYRLREGYLLDWHLFRRLRTRGERQGANGVPDLRAALELVRGTPLAGADIAYSAAARNPYTWLPGSDINPDHLTAAIVDTAHHLTDLALHAGDTTTARWAAEHAWLADIDHNSDITWRDMIRTAAADGNHAELHQLINDLMTARDAEVPEDLDPATYQLLTSFDFGNSLPVP